MSELQELLTRGVANIIPNKQELEKVLQSGKKLRVYQGFDPTGPQLHLGHLSGLKKLKQFQDAGHEVIFLIGDFTGMIGDPTGKDTTRLPLTHEQVLENAKSYKEQAGRVLRFEGENAAVVKFNGEWLGKLSALEFANIARYLSIQQVIERDMFQKRLKNNMNIAMTEFLYPVMQAYDSVEMDVDLEIGGNDQLFNMMLGRELMHKIKRKDKFVMTLPLLADSENRKIGKSEGNVIAIDDTPNELYGKIMSFPDEVIIKAMEALTDIPMNEIQEIEVEVNNGKNPMEAKKKLAFTIVSELNNEDAASRAKENFEKTVQNKELPENIRTIQVSERQSLQDIVIENNLTTGTSAWKRIIEQNGVSYNGKVISNPSLPVSELEDNGILKYGKRDFVKIKKG